ncbi:MAG: hypothetical protein IJH61_03785 [Eubacteriaceae bacterium]|nr:hypothetical protein [Eubacteriaceae bacterium]
MNEYVWELYLKSGGSELVAFFEDNIKNEMTMDFAKRIHELQKVYCVSDDILSETADNLEYCISYINKKNEKDKNAVKSENDNVEENIDEDEIVNADYNKVIDDITLELWDWYDQNDDSNKQAFSDFIDKLAIYTTFWAYLDYDCMIPYYFRCNYNVLERIANAFEIELPEIPAKSDYKARFFHYGELCKVFTEFRIENDLSPFELWAFLYDFAPKYIGGIDSYIISDLPEPKSAFFIGGDGKNADAFAEDDASNITFWQCSPNTRAGDMIVMYLRTPISAISSVWRSCSVGFNDPFFFYYRCTYICNPMKGKRINIKEIKKDEFLSRMPIVKGNMQGINGVELKPSEYNYILDLLQCNAKRLEYEDISADNHYVNERDVEERLIIPFLKNIGYSEEDYQRQVQVPIGNHNHTLIPDFVLHDHVYRGRHSAFAVLEAKKSIRNDKELSAALSQVTSYALLLSAEYAVIASQEGLWITTSKDHYSAIVGKFSWDELADNDNQYKVMKYIGNKKR